MKRNKIKFNDRIGMKNSPKNVKKQIIKKLKNNKIK